MSPGIEDRSIWDEDVPLGEQIDETVRRRKEAMIKVRPLASQILNLTAGELLILNDVLRAEGGEAVGVREPRRPLPEDDESSALPQDYSETAE